VLVPFIERPRYPLIADLATLLVDIFPQEAFSITTCVNLSRCLLAAGAAAVIQPAIDAIGVGWAFTICAAGALASCPLALVEQCVFYSDLYRPMCNRTYEQSNPPTKS
jgi:hypothetical protein